MKKIKNIIRIFLIFILSVSILALVFSILAVTGDYDIYNKFIVFITAIIFVFYFLFNARIDQTLTFTIICVLFNPYINIALGEHVWRILEFPVVCLFIHRLYFLLFENQIKEIEHEADSLDQYFKELEHTIATLTYHQVSIYIKNKYHHDCQIYDDYITWKIKTLPDVEFEVLREFYSLGKNSKGGVNAKLKNKFKNLEIHLNFNLTDRVKLTIKEGKGAHKPNRLARQLKTVLINKYHYLEL